MSANRTAPRQPPSISAPTGAMFGRYQLLRNGTFVRVRAPPERSANHTQTTNQQSRSHRYGGGSASQWRQRNRGDIVHDSDVNLVIAW